MAMPPYIWHQGKLIDFNQATVPFLCAGLHYGVAVFEGIRAYQTDQGPAIFRLRDHIKRLARSASILGIRTLPYTEDQMVEACLAVTKANKLDECYIRPLIYAVEGGMNLMLDEMRFEYTVAAWKWDKFMGEEALIKGVRAKVSSFNRQHVNAAMSKGKISGNYVNSVLARTEVTRIGYEEAIMLDTNGFVSECSAQNLFLVRQGKVIAPPAYSILEGITRETIFTLISDQQIPLSEQLVSRDQLYIADEVFMVGTANEVIAIREIDDRVIGSGERGPITKKLQDLYQEVIHGKREQYQHFLDPIN